MSDEITEGGIGTAIQFAFQKGQATYVPPCRYEPDSEPFVLVPNGMHLESIQEFLAQPIRVSTTREFLEVSSFCRYVEFFDTSRTQIFAFLQGGCIEAVLDYHKPDNANAAIEPSWCQHRAKLILQKSPDWEKWTQGAGTLMSQGEFAEFLEDLAHTVTEPEAAAVCDMALNLQACVDVRFDSKINRFTGGNQLTFTEEVHDGAKGNIRLPQQLIICVPPYRASKPVDMLVRLRVRISEGKAKFQYALDRADRVLEQAFVDICTEIGAITATPYRCP